jgi:hypothetical protein
MPGLTNQSGANYWYGRLCGAVATADQRSFDDATVFRISDSLACQYFGCAEPWFYPTGVRCQESAVLRPAARRLADSLLATNRLYWASVRQRVQAGGQMLAGVGWGSARFQTGSTGLAYALAGVQVLLLITYYIGITLWLWAAFSRLLPTVSSLDVALSGLALAWLTTHADPWADGRYRLLVEPALLMLAARGWLAFTRFRLYSLWSTVYSKK